MKRLIAAATFILAVLNLSAQEFPNLPVNTGNEQHSINLNTGAVNINIPIWQANQDGLSIPIYLSYNSNGIKVKETVGITGLVWKLTVGGSISVDQRGLYDLKNSGEPSIGSGFRYSGYLTDNYPLNFQFLMNAAVGQNDEFADTEPDIFYYNFPGASGKFMFNNTGQIISLNDKSLIIGYNTTAESPLNDEFYITNADGIKYTFRCTDYLLNDNNEPVSPYFALVKAENLNTGAYINITFKNTQLTYTENFTSDGSFRFECNGQQSTFPSSQNTDLDGKRYLTESIITNNSKIEFNYFDNSSLIDNIIISLKQNNIYKAYKKFDLKYLSNIIIKALSITYNENFNAQNTDIVWVKKNNDYQFAYNNSVFQAQDRFDFWGYNNNIDNDLDDIDNTFKANTNHINNLKKITFPKGNSAEYVFETNKFSSFPKFNYSSGAGLRVKKIIEKDEHNNVTGITEYGYQEGKLTTPPRLSNTFYFNVETDEGISGGHLDAMSSSPFILGSSYVQYSTVTEYQGGRQEEPNNYKGKNGKIKYF